VEYWESLLAPEYVDAVIEEVDPIAQYRAAAEGDGGRGFDWMFAQDLVEEFNQFNSSSLLGVRNFNITPFPQYSIEDPLPLASSAAESVIIPSLLVGLPLEI